MNIIHVNSLQDPGMELFASLTDAQLTDSKLSGRGLFIAESCKVINVALNAGYEPVALLTEEKHLYGYAKELVERITSMPGNEELPIYVGESRVLCEITGFTLSRSVVCAMRRRPHPSLEDVLKDAHRIVVIDGVVDTTNIGAIFRSAAALGIDAVLLTPGACDPLNRRAVRVSMANIFLMPWTWLTTPNAEGPKREALNAQSANKRDSSQINYPELLRSYGFRTAAMALSDDSISLDDPVLKTIDRLAIVMGTEGDGLPHETITACDYTVRIPMSHGVDSLNVAAASAVAFWELRK